MCTASSHPTHSCGCSTARAFSSLVRPLNRATFSLNSASNSALRAPESLNQPYSLDSRRSYSASLSTWRAQAEQSGRSNRT